MKRFALALLLLCMVLTLELRLEARRPRTAAQRDRDRGDLIITRALYGTGKKVHDITAPLNAEIHDGHLRIQVRNDTMGGDPAKNRPKTLSISYTFRGREFQETLNENDFLELPGPEAFRDERR